MIRTALLSALTAAGLMLPAATADARPIVVYQPPVYVAPVVTYASPPFATRLWDVSFRANRYDGWRYYGAYDSMYAASCVANQLRHGGVQVVVNVR
jgi:hypothetical protein